MHQLCQKRATLKAQEIQNCGVGAVTAFELLRVSGALLRG